MGTDQDGAGGSGAGVNGSRILVAAQLVLLILLMLSGPILPRNATAWCLEVTGLAAGTWALLVMRLDRLSVFPEPKANARLLDAGPYRWIRHPMYAGVLLFSGGLLANRPIPLRGLVYVGLIAVLLAKIEHEERLLQNRFWDYREYRKRTKKLVPFLW